MLGHGRGCSAPSASSLCSPAAGHHARLAPGSGTAQLALGEAAETLGEFDEALSAYQAAARRTASTTTWLRLGEMADRMGQPKP